MLLQCTESQWACRAASSCVTVSRNCVMQMAHYVVATRLEWGATLLRCTRSRFEGNRLRCPDGPAAPRFHFHPVSPLRSRSRFAIRRISSRARGRMPRGMSIVVMSPASFRGKYISHAARRHGGGQKYAGEKRTPDGVSCWRAENLGARLRVIHSNCSGRASQYSSCIYVTRRREKGGKGGENVLW